MLTKGSYYTAANNALSGCSEGNPSAINKTKAYAYGYYSHVVTDVVFHPFIYRITDDHWKLHDITDNLLNHKKLEARIDSYIIHKYRGTNPFGFKYYKRIVCSQEEDDNLLDKDIFLMLKQCLKANYVQIINQDFAETNFYTNYHELFEQESDDSADHPIHNAYADFIQSMSILYNWAVLLKFVPEGRLQALLPVKELTQEEKESVIPAKAGAGAKRRPAKPIYLVFRCSQISCYKK